MNVFKVRNPLSNKLSSPNKVNGAPLHKININTTNESGRSIEESPNKYIISPSTIESPCEENNYFTASFK